MKLKNFTTLLIAFIMALGLNAQNGGIKKRWNIKADYYSYGNNDIANKMQNIVLEGNYGVFKTLEIGGYAGYGFGSRNDFLYGANLNLHILPMLIKSSNLRLDIYTSGKLGMCNSKKKYYNMPPIKQNELTWGCYLGVSYYLFKIFGVFIETGYEQNIGTESYSFNKQTTVVEFNTHFGITFKF